MYKTIWLIIDNDENTKTELTYYHFKKDFSFPSWYMEDEKVYTIEMLFNLKITFNIKTFFKCLFHYFVIK